ncbi:hypothetical protein Thi970DRAFT_02344 [Thiorhodovibrio frisius]|uniref:Uncharacterized protein n=1 Tax=Thiorhodovibrio frisius TaxID=631362 RepID=H8YZG9_9GAMM|nr:hypothetical protein Thi970DRAFT_02344 [Thiorhodovibrio frisius]WPL24389.1 hypothetical protein Thiofri_04608 [Thiorhodovibrio frisius]
MTESNPEHPGSYDIPKPFEISARSGPGHGHGGRREYFPIYKLARDRQRAFILTRFIGFGWPCFVWRLSCQAPLFWILGYWIFRT